jgi:hypothetical protein
MHATTTKPNLLIDLWSRLPARIEARHSLRLPRWFVRNWRASSTEPELCCVRVEAEAVLSDVILFHEWGTIFIDRIPCLIAHPLCGWRVPRFTLRCTLTAFRSGAEWYTDGERIVWLPDPQTLPQVLFRGGRRTCWG